MQIHVNTGRHIEGGQELKQQIRDLVAGTVGRFAERITRIEVHVTDQNSAVKGGGDDMRCVLEARLAGMRPISVRHAAATPDRAVAGAADKLEKTLKRTLGRLEKVKGRPSYGGDQSI